jgi:hypothetical protein
MAKRDAVICDHAGMARCVAKCRHAKPGHEVRGTAGGDCTYADGCYMNPKYGAMRTYARVCCRPAKAAEGARDGR